MTRPDETDVVITEIVTKHFNMILKEAMEKEKEEGIVIIRTLEWILYTAMYFFFELWKQDPLFAAEIVTKLLNENLSEANQRREKDGMKNVIVSASSLN